jgi:hypothetical protein
VLRAVTTAGARVLVAWAEGDPSQPYVAAWDGGDELQELVFNVGGEAAKHLARSGDTVDCGTLITAAGSIVSYIPPGGTVPSLDVGQSAIALRGSITGSSRIRA